MDGGVVMGKTLVINLQDINLQGDILDVGEENFGVIYSISKEVQDEISLDYVYSNDNFEIQDRKYDACTFFFNLNKIWTSTEKENIIKEILPYIKDNGNIYIWDINKERGKVFNNKIRVLLPKNKNKEFIFKNLNIFCSSNVDETKKILEKYFKIEETKAWEDIFFIKGTKLEYKVTAEEKLKNESVTYSD